MTAERHGLRTRLETLRHAIDGSGEDALYDGEEVASDAGRVTDRAHLGFPARDQDLQLEGEVSMDLGDDVQVVLVRADSLHENQVVSFRHEGGELYALMERRQTC